MSFRSSIFAKLQKLFWNYYSVLLITNYRRSNPRSIRDRACWPNCWIRAQCRWRCPCVINCMASVRLWHSNRCDSWAFDGHSWCAGRCYPVNAADDDGTAMILYMELLLCRRRTIVCRPWWKPTYKDNENRECYRYKLSRTYLIRWFVDCRIGHRIGFMATLDKVVLIDLAVLIEMTIDDPFVFCCRCLLQASAVNYNQVVDNDIVD